MMYRLTPLLCLIIAAGLIFGYVNPTRTESIAVTQAQIDSYDSALAAAERFKQKENELIIARSAIPTEGIARLESFLPDGVNNVQIILDLNALAARSGLTLSDFDSSEDEEGTPVSTSAANGAALPVAGATAALGTPLTDSNPIDSLDMTITATGSYASFRAFLEGVESSLRLLDVVKVTVTDSETGVYTYNMTIRLYWLR